jgi:hypothetical protein
MSKWWTNDKLSTKYSWVSITAFISCGLGPRCRALVKSSFGLGPANCIRTAAAVRITITTFWSDAPRMNDSPMKNGVRTHAAARTVREYGDSVSKRNRP